MLLKETNLKHNAGLYKQQILCSNQIYMADSSWNVMAHGDAREGKWRENLRMSV